MPARITSWEVRQLDGSAAIIRSTMADVRKYVVGLFPIGKVPDRVIACAERSIQLGEELVSSIHELSAVCMDEWRNEG